MYDELSPFDWVRFPENQQCNYNYISLDKLRNNPYKFVTGLPLFEYAYVLCMLTAMRMGGEPTRFVDDLYNKHLNPVLAEYYKHLMKYRFIRGLHMRKYESMKPLITGKYLIDAQDEIKKETVKARKKMREICKRYEETHRR